MFCKQCGRKIKDDARFCPKCGTPQNSVDLQERNDDDVEKTIGFFDSIPSVPILQSGTENQVQNQQKVEMVTANNDIIRKVGNNGKVGFVEAITLFFKNYVNFSGRASKSEYWWAFLFNMMITLIVAFPLSAIIPPVGGAVSLAFIIPGISLAVRRLHDVGKPGTWWFVGLIPVVGGIILLILFLKDSEGDNQWGAGEAMIARNVVSSVDKGADYVNVEQKVVTDMDIYEMVQNHEPINLDTPDAKSMMDSALAKIVPTYTGIESLAGAIMLCNPHAIKENIAKTDTDTLLIICKALGFHVTQGGDVSLLSMVQKNIIATLKTRNL